MHAYRPTLYGTRHAVSAGHYLAALAGFSILEAGGNAVDAGCAAGMALGVLQPDLVNVAGVAPIIIRMADGTLETIAGLGHWPRALPPDLFMREHGAKIPVGVLRTVVPAAPDAWITALERHGTMRFAEIAEPAIRFARDGFAVNDLLAFSISNSVEAYQRWPQNAAIFLPGGAAPKVGDKFVQSDLARTLQYMADQDRAAPDREAGLRAAHDAFYRGDIAQQIVAFQKSEGGYLSADDLANFRSRIEPAVQRSWRGHQVITCGPWCQGPALLEALLLVEKVGLDGLQHNEPEYLHRIIECVKIAMADREYHFGDPQFVDVPLDHLLSPDTIARRAAQIGAKAHPGMPDRLDQPGAAAGFPRAAAALPQMDADTSYACAVDRWGNAFSATPSDGSSTAPVVPGLGLIPSARGSQSRPDPAHPPASPPASARASPPTRPWSSPRTAASCPSAPRAATCRSRRCCKSCSTPCISAWSCSRRSRLRASRATPSPTPSPPSTTTPPASPSKPASPRRPAPRSPRAATT